MDAATLLIVALCLSTFVATVWAVIGWVLKVSPHAVLHWAFSNAAIGTGVLLLYHRGNWPDVLAFFGSDIVLLAGFFALRRGVQCFADLRRTDLEHLIAFGLGATVLAHYRGLPAGEGYPMSVVVTCSLAAYALLCAGREAYGYMRREFERLPSVITVAPMVLSGLLFLLRALRAAWGVLTGEPSPGDLSRTPAFGAFLLGMVYMQLLQSVSLGGVVVTHLMARIRHLSDTDALTGIANRLRLQHVLTSEAQRHRRSGHPYSVVLLDVDHFKSVNDRHGHAAGDQALQAVAQVLKRTARESDTVGRLGGEEFCVVLPETAAAGACTLAERARAALQDETMVFERARMRLTASFGVATSDASVEGWADLLKRADAALYRAKSAGRNRVES